MSLHNVKSKARWYLYKQSGHSWNVSLAKPHSKVRSAEVVKVAQTQWMWRYGFAWSAIILSWFIFDNIWDLGLNLHHNPGYSGDFQFNEPIDLQHLQRVGKSIWTFYWHYPGYILKIPEKQPDITRLCPCASIFGFHLSFTSSKKTLDPVLCPSFGPFAVHRFPPPPRPGKKWVRGCNQIVMLEFCLYHVCIYIDLHSKFIQLTTDKEHVLKDSHILTIMWSEMGRTWAPRTFHISTYGPQLKRNHETTITIHHP